jgi:hypothetical protein
VPILKAVDGAEKSIIAATVGRAYNLVVRSAAASSIVGIGLALGLMSLSACMQPPTPPVTPGSSPIGSANAPAEPAPHFAADAPVDSAQSQQLTNYLHSHQLPLVGARVLSANGGSHQVIVYGYVATPFGKADAADRAREFLNDPGTQVDNRIKVEPDLAANAKMGPPPDNSSNSSNPGNPDIQAYENQQQTAQQQQQYMSQGSSSGSGLMMFLPFLSMFGGSSGFGFGGGSYGGGYGSPYGSPYGGGYGPYGPGYPSYGPGYYPPPPGYGYPYGP